MAILLITANPATINLETFSQYIADSKDIIRYWNHVPFIFCVETLLDVRQMTRKLSPFLQRDFLVVEINPFKMDGVLSTPEAWQWFYSSPTNQTFLNFLEKRDEP